VDFINRLAEVVEKGGMDIYVWSLSTSMRRILTGYAVNFNKRHKRHGHLFQNRYKSIVCQEDSYLKELVRYIGILHNRIKVVDTFHVSCFQFNWFD